jgi:hypothetical protein
MAAPGKRRPRRNGSFERRQQVAQPATERAGNLEQIADTNVRRAAALPIAIVGRERPIAVAII